MKDKSSKVCFKLNKKDSQYKESLQAFSVQTFSDLFLVGMTVVGQLERELGDKLGNGRQSRLKVVT